MTQDIAVLQVWIRVCLLITAICATSFPAVWAFSRWWDTLLGRLLMLQAVSFALAIDLTLLFQIWWPGDEYLQWIFILNAVVFGLIALSTTLLTVTMVRMNYFRRKRERDDRNA